jgi:hypothetical protein
VPQALLLQGVSRRAIAWSIDKAQWADGEGTLSRQPNGTVSAVLPLFLIGFLWQSSHHLRRSQQRHVT